MVRMESLSCPERPARTLSQHRASCAPAPGDLPGLSPCFWGSAVVLHLYLFLVELFISSHALSSRSSWGSKHSLT